MTQEEKAKAYDKALERAKIWKDKSGMPKDKQGILDDIFPELAESEDWLEKQEMYYTKKDVDDAYLKGITDTKGEWVVRGNVIAQILDVQEQYYVGLDTEGNDFTASRFLSDGKIHIWTIQDAKDGDVLISEEGYPFIYASNHIYIKYLTAYCGITNDGEFKISDKSELWTNDNVEPATKEQCAMLFQKMKEAGYEWDAEKKELKKIEDEIEIPFGAKDSELQEVTNFIPKGFHAEIFDDKVVIKKGEKSTAWSEEL